MLKKINFKYLIGALGSLGVCYLTMAGIIQQHIHFAGVANEMGFAMLSLLMGVMLIFGIKK